MTNSENGDETVYPPDYWIVAYLDHASPSSWTTEFREYGWPYPRITWTPGVLLKEDIKRLQLIEAPPDGSIEEDCYQSASYDFRLGEEYFDPSKNAGGIVEKCKNGYITINPFSCVVVSTYEYVNLKTNVVGRFNLRIDLALKGLIVQMGTQVEPGYHGPLFALLQNISDSPIHIKYNDKKSKIFTIEFNYTTYYTSFNKYADREIRDLNLFLQNSDGTASSTFKTILDKIEKQQKNQKKTMKLLSETHEMRRTYHMAGITILSAFIITFIASSVPAYFTPFFASSVIESRVKDEVYKYKDSVTRYWYLHGYFQTISSLDYEAVDLIQNRLLELEKKVQNIEMQDRSTNPVETVKNQTDDPKHTLPH